MCNENCNIYGVLDLAIQMSDEIVIMGHKYIDLDALGSALGLLDYVLKQGKKAYVYINPSELNYSVVKAMDMLPKKLEKHIITGKPEGFFRIVFQSFLCHQLIAVVLLGH